MVQNKAYVFLTCDLISVLQKQEEEWKLQHDNWKEN